MNAVFYLNDKTNEAFIRFDKDCFIAKSTIDFITIKLFKEQVENAETKEKRLAYIEAISKIFFNH